MCIFLRIAIYFGFCPKEDKFYLVRRAILIS